MESDEYDVTDSEDDYAKDDKVLLDYAKKSMTRKHASSDEEVYGFDKSDTDEEEKEEGDDEDEEEDEGDIDMGSDIEDEEKLPDERAWGKKKKSFYSTDFIDQDYDGVYQGEEAEIAELEEQEAKNIQKRLVEQLNDADFSISEAIDLSEAAKSTSTDKETMAKEEIIATDLSKLTKRQKLDLLKKESPEFFVLIQDFRDKMGEANNCLLAINYFKKNVKESFPALEYLQTKLSIILNYCTNMSFYLYLKAKRIPIKNHPILKSLFRYRQLLQQMTDVDEEIIKPQLHQVLGLIKDGKEILLDEQVMSKKSTLKLLSDKQKAKKKKRNLEKLEFELKENVVNGVGDDNDGDAHEEEKRQEPDKKRAITYEMAKNKGLTPKRKKELRNPRVKNRRKYEKAKIRRRGQVRIPRTEIPVYGGESSGIKIGLTKSIKIK